jgi:hypothetical protein
MLSYRGCVDAGLFNLNCSYWEGTSGHNHINIVPSIQSDLAMPTPIMT